MSFCETFLIVLRNKRFLIENSMPNPENPGGDDDGKKPSRRRSRALEEKDDTLAREWEIRRKLNQITIDELADFIYQAEQNCKSRGLEGMRSHSAQTIWRTLLRYLQQHKEEQDVSFVECRPALGTEDAKKYKNKTNLFGRDFCLRLAMKFLSGIPGSSKEVWQVIYTEVEALIPLPPVIEDNGDDENEEEPGEGEEVGEEDEDLNGDS